MRIAPRYGTDADLVALVEAAHRHGIRILLDLVAGHTSDTHHWFRQSLTNPADDRYIWADRPTTRFVASPGPRAGYYRRNFLDCQPALNFGYARPDPNEPWRQDPDAAGPRRNRQAIRDIMSHWLRLGIAGFRCDMAYSLVKDDPGYVETAKIWQTMRQWLNTEHPHAILVSEWGQPATAIQAGFHADFFLHFRDDAWRTLLDTGAGTVRASASPVTPYFAATGTGSASPFVDTYQHVRHTIGDSGFAILPTSNHDFSRLACGDRDGDQLKAAFAMIMTWPTVPAIYYGDEIGMRFIATAPDREGGRLDATNNRNGSRTPMQWDDSTSAATALYLPLDPDPARPTVDAQFGDPTSLLHTVRALIHLRREYPELGSRGTLDVVHTGYPLLYLRAGRYLVAINPSGRDVHHPVATQHPPRPLLADGATIDADAAHIHPHGFGIFDTQPRSQPFNER